MFISVDSSQTLFGTSHLTDRKHKRARLEISPAVESGKVLVFVKIDDFPLSINLFGVNNHIPGVRCRASGFDGEPVVE